MIKNKIIVHVVYLFPLEEFKNEFIVHSLYVSG
jgi:hypothetical protein